MKKRAVAKGKSQKRTFRSDVLESVHELASDLHKVGAIGRQDMRRFDLLCLTPAVEITPEIIRGIREKESVSQPIFAAYMGVTPGLVSQWERGIKRPGGPSQRMLSIAYKKGLRAIA